jgi:peptidoglycan hydrolase FlgJ
MAIGIHGVTVKALQGTGHTSQPANQTATPSPKLVRAAHEFEGMMMKELLKPMTAGNGLTGDGDDSGSGSALGEFAGEALGQGLSQQGGFGIANRIVAQLSHSGNELKNGKVTEKMRGNTLLGTDK